MARRYTLLAWTAAICTYLLIVLGAVVRITGSGMGCGDHWPLCNGRLFPPLDDIGTLIEWSHRLVAALVSVLVAALAGHAWWLRKGAGSTEQSAPSTLGYVALGLLAVQVLLGAVTVKLELPPWSVILHLGTAMLLLATLIVAATQRAPGRYPLLALTLVTVLFGALTANLGAAAGCTGFPLCNGQIIPSGGMLIWVHWIHRLLAYALTAVVLVVAARSRSRGMWGVAALVLLQVTIGATTVLSGLPGGLQAAHVAVGTAVWGAVVLVALKDERPAVTPPGAAAIA